jgi:hypothetical protein
MHRLVDASLRVLPVFLHDDMKGLLDGGGFFASFAIPLVDFDIVHDFADGDQTLVFQFREFVIVVQHFIGRFHRAPTELRVGRVEGNALLDQLAVLVESECRLAVDKPFDEPRGRALVRFHVFPRGKEVRVFSVFRAFVSRADGPRPEWRRSRQDQQESESPVALCSVPSWFCHADRFHVL